MLSKCDELKFISSGFYCGVWFYDNVIQQIWDPLQFETKIFLNPKNASITDMVYWTLEYIVSYSDIDQMEIVKLEPLFSIVYFRRRKK